MSRHLIRHNHLLIPLAFLALTGCQDSITSSTTGPRDIPAPRFSAFPGNNGKLAFAAPDGGIQTMNADGSDPQALTTDGLWPAWSPDGTKIAFSSATTGNLNIYVMNADGTDREQLTFVEGNQGAWYPSWSADGSKITFDLGSGIGVINSGGGNVTALTTPIIGADAMSDWSPDGAKIAFMSVRTEGQQDIYVMDADGNNQVRLTDNQYEDYDPTWSPDGSRIAFTHDERGIGGLADIYVMDADGSDPTNLTLSPTSAEVSAAWSPDGSKIAFIRTDASGNTGIWLMNPDGSGQTVIPSSSVRNNGGLSWQPLPAAPSCVFGPTTYTREGGRPVRITEQFAATPGSYIVDLDDLASNGADGIVKLNGVVIMDGRGTTGEVGPRHHMVNVTLAAANVLEIELRGKKDSKLRVKICPASGAQCYPDLPAPQLSLQSMVTEGGFVRFELDVANYAQFPDALFAQAPDLEACGINTSASRTWIEIYDGNDNLLYGFCAFGAASDLNSLWFATPVDQHPAEAYIVLRDRRCNITYTSNRISLAGIT